MFTRTGTRRRTAMVASLAMAALTLAGCGSGTSTDSSEDGSASDAFPVTIEHALGEATIEAKPERVVTIGWGSVDTAVALGTTPVGMEIDSWGADEDGYLPWTRAAIEERGDELPTTFAVYPEIDIDAIVELEPDLILAPLSGLSQDDYDILSDLAPTVAYPEKAWHTDWKQQIDIIGQALGESEKAKGVISEIEETLATAATDNPEFADYSFAYVYAVEPGSLSLYKSGDARVDIITALGLKEDPTVAEVPIDDDTFTATLGLEQADLLDDVDIVFTWYNDEANKKEIEGQPLFAQVPAVKRGSVVSMVDAALAMASTIITPYSVPYVLDEYIPMISDASKAVER